MVRRGVVIYSDKYEMVNYGEDHPFRRERFLLTKHYFRKIFPEVTFITPDPVDVNLLKKVHTERYINYVRKLSARGFGYLSIDTPVFKGIYEWGLIYCGGSLRGALEILHNRYDVAFNPCGGLHHAKKDSDGGFCVFNDVALVALYLWEKGKRVAIVDIDAHAGDGTMLILYQEPILKISIHEDPAYLYPGIGFIHEVGEGKGYGYTLNIPLPPGSSDNELTKVFREIVLPALRRYSPDYIILQSGVDGYRLDPLTHLSYSSHGYHEVAEMLRKLNKPILMLGGGGYYLEAVPILWATIFSTLIGLFDYVREDAFKLDPKKTTADHSIETYVDRLIDQILSNHPIFEE